MREIRFRAWDKSKKVMWDLADIDSEHNCCSNAYNINKKPDCFDHDNGNADTDLIPMQFTGLKDRNGKEIYEGDILGGVEVRPYKKPPKGLKCLVIWKEATPSCGFQLIDNKKDGEYCLNKNNIKHWEVIGNIHENPELITPSKDNGK